MPKTIRCRISSCGAKFVPNGDLLYNFADGRFNCTACPQCKRLHRGSQLAFDRSGEPLYWLDGRAVSLRASVASPPFADLLALASLTHIPGQQVAMGEGMGGNLMLADRRFGDSRSAAQWLNRIMKGTDRLPCQMRYCRGTLDETRVPLQLQVGCGGCGRGTYQDAYACNNPRCGRVYFLEGEDGDVPSPVMGRYLSAVFQNKGCLLHLGPLTEDDSWKTLEEVAGLAGYPVVKTRGSEGQLFRTLAGRRYRDTDHGRRAAIAYLNRLLACQV